MCKKIISFLNRKGGVGKTSTAINLAYIAAKKLNLKILLVDLDPQGNLSAGLGMTKDSYVNANIYHSIIGKCNISEAIYKTKYDGIDVIPANDDLAAAEIELSTMLSRESKLKKILSTVSDLYDFIFIDCAPSLGLLTVNALTASDECFIPMQAEYFSIEGFSHLYKTISLIQQDLNEKLEVKGVVFTMIDTRNNLHQQVMQTIRSHLGSIAFDSIIPRSIKIAESSGFGRSVIDYAEQSKGAQSYLKLAKEFFKNEINEQELSVLNSKVEVENE